MAAVSGAAPEALRLRIVQSCYEADEVISLKLRGLDGAELPAWTPGAHLDLVLPSGQMRQYSLCGDPADRWHYRIGVLRQPRGRGGSLAVHDTLRVGQLIMVSAPRNTFPLHPARRYLFVAGGIGITPILPMIRQAVGAGAAWSLLYGSRSRTTMAFLDDLARFAPGPVDLRPSDEGLRIDVAAMVTAAHVGAEVYVCGPASLIDDAEARFSAAGVAPRLHAERFAPAEMTPAIGQGTIRVFLQRSGGHVDVPPDRSILTALRDAGHALACSCEQGFCGACETRVLDGIPDHRDGLLSDTERAGNAVMLPCVSRAKTPTLTLDV